MIDDLKKKLFWKYIYRTQRSPQAQTTQHFTTGLRNNKLQTAHAHVILCDFISAQNCANKLSCARLCSQTQMSSPEDYPSLNWLSAQHSWQHRWAHNRTHTSTETPHNEYNNEHIKEHQGLLLTFDHIIQLRTTSTRPLVFKMYGCYWFTYTAHTRKHPWNHQSCKNILQVQTSCVLTCTSLCWKHVLAFSAETLVIGHLIFLLVWGHYVTLAISHKDKLKSLIYQMSLWNCLLNTAVTLKLFDIC